METKTQVKREMKPQDSNRERLSSYFWIWAGFPTSKPGGQTGLPASLAIPGASSSGVGLGKSSTIACDRTEPRPVENRVDC